MDKEGGRVDDRPSSVRVGRVDSPWKDVKKSLWYDVSEYGVECIGYGDVISRAETVFGVPATPRMRAVCRKILRDIHEKCLYG